MDEFYDSSAFAKLFLTEVETPKLAVHYLLPGKRVVSRLAFAEVRSAIQRLSKAGLLTPADVLLARAKLDAERNHVEIIPVDEAILLLAEALLERHQIRTLDSIQLASAISTTQRAAINFVCADDRLSRAATIEGLTIVHPRDL